MSNMSNMTANRTDTSPRRLRNHSVDQSSKGPVNTNSMSGNFNKIIEDAELAQTQESIIQKDEFQKKNTAQKLDAVADAINKMYLKMNGMPAEIDKKLNPMKEAIFDQEEGILPQLQVMVDSAKGTDARIQTLTEENLQLRDELDILKGVVHKMSQQMNNSNDKLNQLIARSMSENLIISGIVGDLPKANARKQVIAFLKNEMDIAAISKEDIIDAYRLGQPEKGRERPVVIQCVSDLRQYILDNANRLKDRFNEIGGRFYINPQLPDALAEQRREIRQNIKERKDKEKAIGQQNKSTFAVRAGKLYINGQQKKKLLTPPTVLQLFPEEEEQKAISAIRFQVLKTKPEGTSQFRAAIFRPKSLEDVRRAYTKLFQDYPSADHIAAAFKIGVDEDYQDNQEFGVGFRLLKVIREAEMDNTAVFIIRFYGGSNLGPRRFVIMTDLAREAIKRFIIDRQPSRPSSRSTSPSPNEDDGKPSTELDDQDQDQSDADSAKE